MAGIKISELPEACCVVGDELVAIVQDSCTKFVAASAIGATGDSTITSVIAGCGLQGGGSFGAVTINMDSNCLNKYDGTTSTVRSTSACWDSAYTTVQASSACWGTGGSGSITGFDASGDGITVDDSDPSSVVVEVDSTVVRTTGNQTIGGTKAFTGDICTIGNILSAGVDLDQLFGSGGGTSISGTNDKVAIFNAAGNNVEDSNITDTGTLVCIESNTDIFGNVTLGGVNDPHTMDATVTNAAIIGGADGTITNSAEYSVVVGGESNKSCSACSVTVGGMSNETNANFSVTLGGSVNKTCGSGIQSAVVGGCTNIAKHSSSVIAGGTDMTTVSADMLHTNSLYIKTIPDTDPGVDGVVYQSSGDIKVSDDNVTVADVSGTASTFGSSVLYFSSDSVTYGPVSAAVSGSYYKPIAGNETDELSVAFYSDAAEIEIKIERSQSSIQFYVDDVPVHEFAVAGYSNRLLKLSHNTAKVRKYEIRGKSYGFGGVYTNTSSSDYQVWPYETRRERPLLLVMTDSYGTAVNSIYGVSFVEKLADLLDMDLHSDSLNSSGWSSTGSSATTARAANQIVISRAPAVILACLGYNDKSSPNQTNIENGINNWHSTVTGTFGSAAVMLASPWTPVGVEANLTTVSGYISGRATALGADFIDINGVVTTNNQAAYTSNDNTHPSAAGHDYLARRIQALMLRTGNVPSTY